MYASLPAPPKTPRTASRHVGRLQQQHADLALTIANADHTLYAARDSLKRAAAQVPYGSAFLRVLAAISNTEFRLALHVIEHAVAFC